ncbi:hypothetical protein O6H91_01G025200 [Diphasiastrum complanatum]|uniref:Uncharacterized protein n=1 Tax=Diphasiastrum complanatum TaxID=34168 RepID=A0ACC2EP59_DIPCM|nr:hypothetical protein O6H91_01G025200 [Diphasiastrum complanatum]
MATVLKVLLCTFLISVCVRETYCIRAYLMKDVLAGTEQSDQMASSKESKQTPYPLATLEIQARKRLSSRFFNMFPRNVNIPPAGPSPIGDSVWETKDEQKAVEQTRP